MTTSITKQDIEQGLSQGVISIDDLTSIISSHRNKNSAFSNIITYIGIGFVLFGTSVLYAVYWPQFDSLLKILSTIGIGVVMWLVSVLFGVAQKHPSSISNALHLSGSVLCGVGVGLYATDVMKYQGFELYSTLSIGFGFLFVIQLIQYFFVKTWPTTLTLAGYFTLLFWFVYALIRSIYQVNTPYPDFVVYVITGGCYLLTSYVIAHKFIHLSRLGEIFGGMFVYGGMFGLMMEDKLFYGIIFLLTLVFGLLYVFMRKLLIGVGISIFWIYIYISWVSGEYFQNQAAWGQSLIVVGLLCLGGFHIWNTVQTTKISPPR